MKTLLLLSLLTLSNSLYTGMSRFQFFLKHQDAKPKTLLDSVYTIKIKAKTIRVVFSNDTVSSWRVGK